MNEYLDDDYEPDEEEEQFRLAQEEAQIQQQEQKEKSYDEIKLMIKKKVIRYNRNTGDPFESWFYIMTTTMIPAEIKSEKMLCWKLLMAFGEGEYFIQTWRTYNDFSFVPNGMKKKRNKKKALSCFWKGMINRMGFCRDGGELRGVISSIMPLKQFITWDFQVMQ